MKFKGSTCSTTHIKCICTLASCGELTSVVHDSYILGFIFAQSHATSGDCKCKKSER